MSRHSACVWIAGPLSFFVALALLAPRPAAAPAADEVRGLWVLRSSLTSPGRVRQMVDMAQRAGFNTLLVQVRGHGDAYYDSRIEPRAIELDDESPTFDPLTLTLTAAHAAGLKVHAWVSVDLVSSATTLSRARTHVTARHPEWLMVPRSIANTLRAVPPDLPSYLGDIARATRATGGQIDGLYLSPILPAARDYLTSVITDLVSRYPLDGLHLDDLRYPSDQFDYSTAAIAAFRAEVAGTVPHEAHERLDRLAMTDITSWPDALPGPWAQFRRDRLTQLAASMRVAARAARPGISVSVAVASSADEARSGRLQDWRQWARTGIVDAICPMDYTLDAAEFAATVARVKADAAPAPVWAGIGVAGPTLSQTRENLRTARKAGLAGVLLYSYDSLTAGDAPPDYVSLIRAALLDQALTPNKR